MGPESWIRGRKPAGAQLEGITPTHLLYQYLYNRQLHYLLQTGSSSDDLSTLEIQFRFLLASQTCSASLSTDEGARLMSSGSTRSNCRYISPRMIPPASASSESTLNRSKSVATKPSMTSIPSSLGNTYPSPLKPTGGKRIAAGAPPLEIPKS